MAGSKLRMRAYKPADKAACLGVFDSNLPQSMTLGERVAFTTDLDRETLRYFVVQGESHRVVACGGYDTETRKLCWGMVDRSRQRHGIGSYLLRARLRRIYEEYGATEVRLETSRHALGFFERHGFRVEECERDYYAPGLDRYDMVLTLGEDHSHVI